MSWPCWSAKDSHEFGSLDEKMNSELAFSAVDKILKRRELSQDFIWKCRLPCGENRFENVAGPGLYAGDAGIAYMLCLLAKEIGSADAYRVGIDSLERLITKKEVPNQSSFWFGTLGAAWALSDINRDDNRSMGPVKRVVESLPTPHGGCEALYGAAGIVLGLIGIWERSACNVALEKAFAWGNYICSRIVVERIGVRWEHFSPAVRPLCGFAHGQSGPSLALLVLFEKTGIKRFLSLALEAMAYEDQFFSDRLGNWPDFRIRGAGPQLSKSNSPSIDQVRLMNVSAWCHAGAGCSLVRAYATRLGVYNNTAILSQSVAAIAKATQEKAPGCLCHGSESNLLLLNGIVKILDTDLSLLVGPYKDVMDNARRRISKQLEIDPIDGDIGLFLGWTGRAFIRWSLDSDSRLGPLCPCDLFKCTYDTPRKPSLLTESRKMRKLAAQLSIADSSITGLVGQRYFGHTIRKGTRLPRRLATLLSYIRGTASLEGCSTRDSMRNAAWLSRDVEAIAINHCQAEGEFANNAKMEAKLVPGVSFTAFTDRSNGLEYTIVWIAKVDGVVEISGHKELGVWLESFTGANNGEFKRFYTSEVAPSKLLMKLVTAGIISLQQAPRPE